MTRQRLISASAGTGKTYTLVGELERRLEGRDGPPVPPEGVIVTTFTRKAAGEIAERARAALSARGETELSARLSAGLIGTVHSVCGELLRRFAFEAGLSPEVRVLEEEEARRVFAESLSGCLDPATVGRLHELGERLGQSEESRFAVPWRQAVLQVVDQARVNALDAAGLERSAALSIQRLLALLPERAAAPAEAIDGDLATELRAALAALEGSGDATKDAVSFRASMEACLERLERREPLNWSEWLTLSRGKVGKKGREAVERLCALAGSHESHPRFQDDLARYIRLVFQVGASSLEAYSEWKRDRRLLDFADLEAETLRLLEIPGVAARISEEVELLLVDEFQDTSPIQLALFLRLSGMATESIWVGDPKQSIYEFRGADPALMAAVLRSLPAPGPDDILSVCRRSRPELVRLVSELFATAFEPAIPPAQVRVEPFRPASGELPPPLLHWRLETRNAPDDAAALAAGVSGLLGGRGGEPALQVSCPETGAVRPLRLADVAILCLSNHQCRLLARALGRLGIPAAWARPGLLETPEARLVLASARRLLDPLDTVATSELILLAGDPPAPEEWLSERLAYLAASMPEAAWRQGHPVLTALERRRPELEHLAPSEAIDLVMDCLDAPRRVAGWGRAQDRRENLEALRALADEYEDVCAGEGGAASLSGLLHWLERLASEERDDQAQSPSGEAVQVLTVHRAKGLEWPVVVIADLDAEPRERLWGIQVVQEREEVDLAEPLAGRWIRFWPWPYGTLLRADGLQARLEGGPEMERARREARDSRVRLLYVAMTRARDVLVLPARHDAGGPRHKWLDLVLRPDEGAPRLTLPADAGTHAVPLAGTDLVMQCVTEVLAPLDEGRSDLPAESWFPPSLGQASLGPGRLQPSGLAQTPEEAGPPPDVIRYGPPLTISGSWEAAEMGTALHAVLASDDPSSDRTSRLERARATLERFGVESYVDADEMLALSAGLHRELGQRHAPLAVLREWPLRLRHAGVLLEGSADLVCETAGGYVLVDHKSAGLSVDDPATRALKHRAQLAVYALGIERATGRPVAAAYLNLLLAASLVRVPLPSGDELASLVERAILATGRSSGVR